MLTALVRAALLALLIGGFLVAATITDNWPRSTCHGIQPFGQNDRACVYWIGR